MKCKSWTRTSIKITSYLGTDSGSSRAELDEVKMVLYIAEECGMPCFHWLFTKRQMSIRTDEVWPYCFFFFALVEARAEHIAITEAAWLFQGHAVVTVGADMMQK